MFDIKDYVEADNFRLTRYRDIVERYSGVKETEDLHYSAKGRKIKEQLVKCIWSEQLLKKKKLYTEDGLRLEVISPGRWNLERGPDFKGAEILLEGKGLVKGDVEIHICSRDWIRHGHNKQEEYESVCLHVFMWNDGRNKFIKFKNHFIPQLELYKYLEFKLDKLIEMIDIEDFPHPGGANAGPCQKQLRSISFDDKMIGHFLDFAGDERILVKTNRIEKLLKKQTFEQILYETIMESLGYKNNKAQFRQLASIVSINDIRSLIPIDISTKQRCKRIQALLFGMAGLLPCQHLSSEITMDKYSLRYVTEIEGMWTKLKREMKNEPMKGTLWRFGYTRPSNFPTRRIAAISCLLAENYETGLFRKILESFEKMDSNKSEVRIKTFIKNTGSILLELFDEYWSHYYVFGGKRIKNPERLVGRERSSVILINIILPILLAYARKGDDLVLEEKLFKVYKLHPKLSPNNVTRFMSCRIFGNNINKKKIVNTARRQQGLLQIFKDFCESDNIACKRCALLLSIN